MNNQCTIFLFSRNLWNLSFLNFEKIKAKKSIYLILVIFNEIEVPQQIKQYFDFVIKINTPLTADNISICFNEVVEALEKKIHSHNEYRVITYNENLVLLSAMIREKFSISGLHEKQAVLFTDKYEMKKALADSVMIPKYILLDRNTNNEDLPLLFNLIKTKLALPFILKPTSLSGSRMVAIISSFEEFQHYYFNYVLKENLRFLAEEYIHGQLFHCDSVIDKNGDIISFISQYNFPMHFFLHGKNVGSMVLDQEEPICKAISKLNQNVLNIFNTKKGIYHLECFSTKNNELFFLEIAARPGGGKILKMYEKCFDFNLIQVDFDDHNLMKAPNQKGYAAWILIPNKNGVVCKFNDISLNSSIDLNWNISLGHEIKCSRNLADVAGSALLFSNDKLELEVDYKYISEFEPYEIADAYFSS